MKKLLTTLFAIAIFSAGLFLQSCDPVYSISVSNQTKDKISVIAYTTSSFGPDESVKIHPRPDDPNWIGFNMEPGTTVRCGSAIGGLYDDLPFTQLIIYTPQDTITATDADAVLDLFDKDIVRDRPEPAYQITIK